MSIDIKQLAKQWLKTNLPEGGEDAEIGFLAGYQAAKDSQEYLMNEMKILRSRLDAAEKLSQLVDEEKEQ